MTTSNDPDQIRRDIEATRAGLSADVNALSDKVSPAQIAARQKTKIAHAASSVKDSIMGSAESATSTAQDALSSVGDTPSAVKSKTRGNPLAAGLIAFGAGVLVSSLFPASEKESQAAVALKEKAQPLVEEVTSVAKETAGHLQEPAQNALESVRSTATDAVDTVKDEAGSAADDVKGQAQDAKDSVRNARDN